MFKDKKILVTGGTGLIGHPLVEMLIQRGAKVRIASLDAPERAHPEAEFCRVDLRNLGNCLEVCDGVDYVFSLVGIKGSPAMAAKKPGRFFFSTLTFSVNMLEAARQCGVKKYLYTSSVGVYAPAAVFCEDDVWKTFPSEHDRFPGWAKRMGELQVDAYRVEYGWNDVNIVRPANVYGPHDNFDPDNAMVIPSLIKRAVDGENPLTVWGDGTPIRDFIHARDVARGMILVMEKNPGAPVNLGSGTGVTIREIVEAIVNQLEVKPKVVWDTSKPLGDRKRLMDKARAASLGFQPEISLEEGIRETMAWYRQNKNVLTQRYNIFAEGAK